MAAELKPVALRCEHLQNPLGFDIERPRLSWKFECDRDGARQTAYDIEVGTERGGRDLWSPGLVTSNKSVYIPYEGRDLEPGERAYWRVRVWDEQEEMSVWSEDAFWEAGITDWQALWIGGNLSGGPRTSAPAPFLRKEIQLQGTPKRARLYASALGVYEFRINGEKVGEDFFAPGWTDYNKRVQYQAYDITHRLQAGANALGAVLGDGWFCGNVEWRGRQLYGDQPWLLAQIEVEYGDGQREVFATDGTWTFAYGPILESDMLMGESYDARKEFPGWDRPGFEGTWHPVATKNQDRNLVGMRGPTVKATQEIHPLDDPKKMDRWPSPDYIFDLGQNLVGFVRLKVKGEAGKTVRLRFGEVLTDKGLLYTENLRSAKQTDYYTLKGDPDGEIWEPRFSFHGFRYVEVRDYPGEPTKDSIVGVVLHSDTPKTGEFECSDELVNQLQRNIDWGQRGNFVDIPTDCPQRDERLGWTGDAQVFVRTAAFNRDVAGFFTKWALDCADAQGTQGQIPPTVPTTGVVGGDGGPAWADAVVICPWTIYQCYGDRRILEENYDVMSRFMEYLDDTHDNYIRCYPGYNGFRGFGDWLSINAETPHDLIGTAFLAYDAQIMMKVAQLLGHDSDRMRFAFLHESARDAFQRRYLTPDGLVTPQTQTAYLLALQFDLLPTSLRETAAKELERDLGSRGWHISAGFVGSSYTNHVLTEAGMTAVAYKLLFQKTWPSWLYPVTKGATTIWERWDGWTDEKGFQDAGMNSFNHYAYGAIGSWLYQRVAGIDLDPERPGYERIVFIPRPTEELTWARASLESIRGRIESSWTYESGAFNWQGLVPPNTTATFHHPFTGKKIELASGHHEIS